MMKELSPSLEMVACDVCGRTILKGEHTEPYLVPDGSRRLVCDLCVRRAEGAGWLREALHGDMPAAVPRTEPRLSLLTRLRRRLEERPATPGAAQRAGAGQGDQEEVWEREASAELYEEPATRYEPEEAFDGASAPAHPEDRGPARAERLPHDETPAEAAEWAPAEDAAAEEEADETRDDWAVEERARAEESSAPPAEAMSNETVESIPPVVELPPEEQPIEDSLLRDAAQDELVAEGEPPVDWRAERRERRERRRLRDPRHVRAVPTNAEAKVERALEIFNGSDYRRTVGGLVRTLGQPWVAALPHEDSTSEVTVVVAWELSWYQFRVDLGDSHEPVAVADKGHEVNEIDYELRRWNATATDDGALEVGAAP